MAKITKAQLEAKIEELEAQLDVATGDSTIMTQHSSIDFIRCPDYQVGLFTKEGTPICLLPSQQWISIVARMSVGGANSTNVGIAMRLHEGR